METHHWWKFNTIVNFPVTGGARFHRQNNAYRITYASRNFTAGDPFDTVLLNLVALGHSWGY